MAEKRPVAVEVRAVRDPDGRPAVLVQLDDGWFVLPPEGALQVAALIVDTAAECLLMPRVE